LGINNSDLKNIVKFLEMAGRLKRTPREGWIEVGIHQPESVGDHTFRTSILCMVYADMEGLDQLKLQKMALIHDLPEAIIGDLTPSKKSKESKEKENIAINKILTFLPRRLRKEYRNIWDEYKKGQTREAKAVGQLEKLEMALQAVEYEKANSTVQNLNRFIESAEKSVVWPELRRFLSLILEERS